MKRNFRTTIVLILALLLAFGSICFVSAEPEEKPFTHLVLGDSANLGFALKSYLARNGEGSFYLDKFPAYVNAFHADDTPRAYNAASAVSHMHRVEDAVKETVKESVKTVVKAVSETIRNNICMAIGTINGKKTSR